MVVSQVLRFFFGSWTYTPPEFIGTVAGAFKKIGAFFAGQWKNHRVCSRLILTALILIPVGFYAFNFYQSRLPQLIKIGYRVQVPGTTGTPENRPSLTVFFHFNDVGGIAGHNDGIVQYCYVTGSVTGSDRIGGIVGCNKGSVRNCVALNLSIITSSRYYSARVANSRADSGYFSTNYASVDMRLPNNINVTSNINGIHGADIEASDYNNQTWWTTSSNWDFITIWQWDSSTNLPKLR
ncbi:MAG: hypothetical protein LBV17_02135 [Treponema sp.]|nr:hypothetical protein [Treponema sp.]